MQKSKKTTPAKDLIPHRPPMLLIQYVGTDNDEVFAGTVVDEAWPVLEGQSVPPPVLVELLAQSYGAIAAFRQKNDASPKDQELLGFLVGVKNFTSHCMVKTGDELLIKTLVAAEIGNFNVVEARIFKGETTVASGQIKVFAAPRSEMEAAKTLGEA